jgi:hypothetical protein
LHVAEFVELHAHASVLDGLAEDAIAPSGLIR